MGISCVESVGEDREGEVGLLLVENSFSTCVAGIRIVLWYQDCKIEKYTIFFC